MQLPGRIAAAIEVLADLETRHRPVSLALKDWGNAHRFAGSGDRAAIGNLVYDALRKRTSHAHIMQSDSSRALALSVAVQDWEKDPHELNDSFANDKFAPEALSDAELAALTKQDPLADAPGQTLANVPEWLVPSLKKAFSKEWVAEAEEMANRPPLDLRVNTLKSDRHRVQKALKRHHPKPTAIAPDGLRIAAGAGAARTPNVLADEAYKKGWFEIQDQGSQLVSILSGAEKTDQVLDLCAGAGGKTLALAAMMENKGQIFAYDADRNRLAPIFDRLKRNNARNVQTRSPDEGALDDLVGKMDRVLIDAPCTGTGTWRRRPDTKWRLTPEQLTARCEEQAKILRNAVQYVKPGGVITYITCSILPEENEQQIDAFLDENKTFAPVDMAALWAEKLPAIGSPHYCHDDRGAILTPLNCQTDGFFVSVLQRTAE